MPPGCNRTSVYLSCMHRPDSATVCVLAFPGLALLLPCLLACCRLLTVQLGDGVKDSDARMQRLLELVEVVKKKKWVSAVLVGARARGCKGGWCWAGLGRGAVRGMAGPAGSGLGKHYSPGVAGGCGGEEDINGCSVVCVRVWGEGGGEG
jgi:hypothetical protein